MNIKSGLEKFDGHYLFGWAIDEDDPDKELEISLLVNSSGIKITNNNHRIKLEKKYNTQIGGFFYAIPPAEQVKGIVEIIIDCELGSLSYKRFLWISHDQQLDMIVNESKRLKSRFDMEQMPVDEWAHSVLFPKFLHIARQQISSQKTLHKFNLLNFVTSLHKVGKYDSEHSGRYFRVYEKTYARLRKRGFKVMLQKLQMELDERHLSINKLTKWPEIFELPRQIKKSSRGIDVVIPCYRGYVETKECIESVLQAKTKVDYHIVIINDQSPEDKLIEYLEGLSSTHDNITLISNEINLGFVGSVNLGMRFNEVQDIVLLNSDTHVADNWLDGILDIAKQESNIGTVTPMSNRATICSFPVPNFDNDLPSGYDTNSLNKLFAETNKSKFIDIPSAVGFCMYIRRDLLNEIGYFDAEKWGKGYGEENEFSIKAENHGWRNVAACNVFVEHKGSVSFQEDKNDLAARNLQILLSEYPDYNNKVQRFIQNDPLEHNRNQVIINMLKDKYILMVSHDRGGGTHTFIENIAQQLRSEGHLVLLLLGNLDLWTLSNFGTNIEARYQHKNFYALIKDLIKINIDSVHIHQDIYFPFEIWKLAEILHTEYVVSIHDYVSICPRVHLHDADDLYCGEPDEKKCHQCIKDNGIYSGLRNRYKMQGGTIETWRSSYQKVFEKARNVFVPSEDVSNRLGNHFSSVDFIVKEHPFKKKNINISLSKVEGKEEISVCMLGAIGPLKGFNLLVECLNYVKQHNLPINFTIIGYVSDPNLLENYKNVTVTGPYKENELSMYIKKYDCDIALLLSTIPETYSYTLSEALSLNVYPIVLDIGSMSQRLKQYNIGSILPLKSTAKEITEEILRIKNIEENEEVEIGQNYEKIYNEYYA